MGPANLWGASDWTVPERTPSSILKEQATTLSEMTKGILNGDVRTTVKNNQFTMTLSIVAPAINNYTFDIVRVQHGLALYPLKVVAAGKEYSAPGWIECRDEDAFITELTTILQSETVRKAVGTLIAQSKNV